MQSLKPYFFKINVVPMQENKVYESIAGAIAHIWVISNDRESAKIRAIDYNKKFLWKITSFVYELGIHEEQIPELGEEESYLYHSALRHGIAAEYIAYQKRSKVN